MKRGKKKRAARRTAARRSAPISLAEVLSYSPQERTLLIFSRSLGPSLSSPSTTRSLLGNAGATYSLPTDGAPLPLGPYSPAPPAPQTGQGPQAPAPPSPPPSPPRSPGLNPSVPVLVP